MYFVVIPATKKRHAHLFEYWINGKGQFVFCLIVHDNGASFCGIENSELDMNARAAQFFIEQGLLDPLFDALFGWMR